MAKIIYAFKIDLFRYQFHLSNREMAGLQQFSVFVVRLYGILARYTCTAYASASRNDLQFCKDLVAYHVVNKPVANTAIKSFMHHLWYLNEELIDLAFFHSSLSSEEKAKLRAALSTESDSEMQPSRLILNESEIAQKLLSDFVTQNTRKFFVARSMHMELQRRL